LINEDEWTDIPNDVTSFCLVAGMVVSNFYLLPNRFKGWVKVLGIWLNIRQSFLPVLKYLIFMPVQESVLLGVKQKAS
jgi:hypothetical protein